MLLERLLKRLIVEGRLVLIDENGRRTEYGRGSDANPSTDAPLTLRLNGPGVARRLAWDADPALGEAYMDGDLVIENGRIYDFLALVGRNIVAQRYRRVLPVGVSRALGFAMRTVHQLNPVSRSRRNVAHHYDLSGALYDLFLDEDRQYSCAYFDEPDLSLDEAQRHKKQHIINKLMLEPGQKVLDIGCGWGGMALSIAKEADVEVLGVTLSTEQFNVARRRAEEAGLSDRVKFELQDYRTVDGPFDRIVSVGMFEHVGVPHYAEFFNKVRELLSEDGVALVHSIGRNEPPGITSPFIRKYIFPGGYIPALSEVLPRVERAGLFMTDIEILRLHYAETLRHWRMRFLDNWDKAKALYDERFCRMWEFYLAGSEMSFRYDRMMVFQLQLSKALETVPMSRDYMYRGQ